MGLVQITAANWVTYKRDIDEIESQAVYPLGRDYFRIKHGENYFAFFNRLGRLYFFGWVEGTKLVSVAAAVLRNLSIAGRSWRTWYLCDLKVHESFRGRHIPIKMFFRALPTSLLRCTHGYAISMDTPADETNRAVRLLSKSPIVRFRERQRLQFWSLDFDSIERVRPLLERHRGRITFLSLNGVKDIVLQSTGLAMNLWHAQFGPMAQSSESVGIPGGTHMFCTPKDDLLSREIQTVGFEPSATATILSYRFEPPDWNWILTSDI